MRTLRPSSRTTYAAHWNKWVEFANKEGYDPLFPTDATLVRLLFHLENKGVSTNILKGVRAAVGSLGSLGSSENISSGPLTKMFMLGRCKTHPMKPRYSEIWSPAEMLTSLKELRPTSLTQWNQKIIGVLKLLLCFRDDDLHGLKRPNIRLLPDALAYRLFQPKTLRHGDLTDEYVVSAIPGGLSIVDCVREYLEFSRPFVTSQSSSLVIGPTGVDLSKRNIADVSKALMRKHGIDTTVFKSHSFRSAGSTWMVDQGMSISAVMKIGRWVDQTTFVRHYLRCTPRLSREEAEALSKAVGDLPAGTDGDSEDSVDLESDEEVVDASWSLPVVSVPRV